MRSTEAAAIGVAKIEELIDKSTMLGAAWDCLSADAKERFRNKMLEAVLNSIEYYDQDLSVPA
jgi:polyphosphate kinase 2 (PPK2 family)